MMRSTKCPNDSCSHVIPLRLLDEKGTMGGKFRLYEGECPDHGLFNPQEMIPRQDETVELPPTGNFSRIRCPTTNCLRDCAANITDEKRAMAFRLRIFEAECPEHGVFSATQTTPYQRAS